MSYYLKLFNINLIEFEVIENVANPVLSLLWIDEKNRDLLPMTMEISEKGLSVWIRHRVIPQNRANVSAFLAKCGLSSNRPMDIINVCKGLSLNDSYWVVSSDDNSKFDDYNLYDNPISRILAQIAFTGYGSSERSAFASSPEFTTNGMLPKCWRRQNGMVSLYKGATSGASNTGMESYSELYAYQIAQRMNINAVPYRLAKWKGTLCSVCDLFTDKETSFIPVGRLVKDGGMKAVKAYYQELGPKYAKALNEMIVFDAIIVNTDRHFGNFGFLADSETNKITTTAPLFDHGNSLFNQAGYFWNDENELRDYIDTLQPCTYDDFIGEAKSVLDKDLRKKVRLLLDFSFERTGKYNYSKERLRLIEKIVRERAKKILE